MDIPPWGLASTADQDHLQKVVAVAGAWRYIAEDATCWADHSQLQQSLQQATTEGLLFHFAQGRGRLAASGHVAPDSLTRQLGIC